VRDAYLPAATAEKAGGKEFFAVPNAPAAVHFADPQTLVLSDRAGMAAYLGRKPAAGGGKLAAFLAASAGKPLVMAVNVKALPVPPDALKQVPPDFKPLLDADLATVTLSLDPAPGVAARLVYGSADEATAAEVALKKGLKQLKPLLAQGKAQMLKELGNDRPADAGPRPPGDLPMAVSGLVGLGLLNTLEELLDKPPVKKDGDALAAELALPAGSSGSVAVAAVGVGLLLPAVQKVREAASRAQSTNNLKQIALACHIYHDAHGHFPPAAITDKKTGKRLLSWRVAILPYIEQEALYRKFKLDEPWDSPHNLPLSKVLVKVYTDPRGTADPASGLTYYKAFVGGGAAWDWAEGKKLQKVTDGTSNTLLVGAFGPPVPWTKPDDLEFNPKGELPDLFTPPFNVLLAAFCDGSVRAISPTIDRKVLRALITASGGERVGGNDIP
jgi:hypothetical protein